MELYLDELVLWLAVHHDISISVSTLQKDLTEAGLTRHILHKIALERDEVLLQQWRDMLASDDFLGDGSQFVCVSETGKNEMTELKDVFVPGDQYSLVAALTVDGYIAADSVVGSFDSMDFLEFVQEHVILQMNPYPDERSVLVLDSCRIHHKYNAFVFDLIRAAGCLVLYLPEYSPDINPIEESFGALKEILRRNGAEIRREHDPIAALIEASGYITTENSRAWFKRAGYIR